MTFRQNYQTDRRLTVLSVDNHERRGLVENRAFLGIFCYGVTGDIQVQVDINQRLTYYAAFIKRHIMLSNTMWLMKGY